MTTLERMKYSDVVTKREVDKFNRVLDLCDKFRMTNTEAMLCIASGDVMPTMDDLAKWRLRESKGIRWDVTTPGLEALCSGKSSLESKGSMCWGYQRKQMYGEQQGFLSAWEGTDYWDCFPRWYTERMIPWHPRYRPVDHENRKRKMRRKHNKNKEYKPHMIYED